MTSNRARRLAAQLRNLLDVARSFPDALVLLNGECRVRWFNPAAKQLLGLRWPDDRGVALTERFSRTSLGDWLASGAVNATIEIAGPASESVTLDSTLIPFGHQQKLLLVRDVSDLDRLEKVRRDFVANVSHELRTPLTVIHGYLELLDGEDVPTLAPVLTEMRAQSRRMGQIVEDLLTLSRLEMQQHLVEEEVVLMSSMLASLRKEAEALSQGRHTISVEDAAKTDMLGSTKELHSAFSNLVSNAVRYTPTGGSIFISWRRTSRGIEYAVRDTGYGIPANHLTRLTERFYRVSSSRSRELGGTGLGLSIVKHVLNLHEGRLLIESEPGKGSTFTCVFDASRIVAPEQRGQD